MNKINRKDLVQEVADKGHLSKKDARTAIDIAFDLIEKSLLDGQEANVTNFGVFTPKTKQQRDGTDPRKHSRIVIEAKHTVIFRPSKQMKEKLNK